MIEILIAIVAFVLGVIVSLLIVAIGDEKREKERFDEAAKQIRGLPFVIEDEPEQEKGTP